jgi:protocatechuate 3,4-dioxygenase beta subunit
VVACLALFSIFFIPRFLGGDNSTHPLGKGHQDLPESLSSDAPKRGGLDLGPSKAKPQEREGVSAKTLLVGRVEGSGEFPMSLGSVLLLPAPPQFSGGLGEMIQKMSQGKGVLLLAPSKNKGKAIAKVPLAKNGSFRFVSPPVGRFALVLDHPFFYFQETPTIQTKKDEKVVVGPFRAKLGGLLEVRAMDSQGLPLKGVKLRIQSRPDFSKMMDPATAGDPTIWVKAFLPLLDKTDAKGRAYFRGLPPGKFIVHGSKKAFTSQFRESIVRPGTRQILRFVFPRGLILRVLLKDPDSKPVAGVGVRVEPQKGATTWGMGFGGAQMKKESLSQLTDSHGIARFDTLSSSSLLIRVRAPGFVEVRRTVSVFQGGGKPIEIQLDRGLSFEGIVTDTHSVPLKGIRVAPLGEAGQEFMGFSGASILPRKVFEAMAKRRGVDTDEKGHFVLWGFSKGQKTKLMAVGKGYAVQMTSELKAGKKGIRILCPKHAVLLGRVLDLKGGTPINHFTVKAERSAFMMFKNLLAKVTVENKEGKFRVEGLPPGVVQISIKAKGKNDLLLSKTLVEGKNDLGVLKMRPPLVVEGRVIDNRGRGLPGVDVWVSRGRMADNPEIHRIMGLTKVKSGKDGFFRLVGVPEGRFRLGAFQKGLSLKRSKVLKVPPKLGVLKDVVLEMNQGGVVEGTITTAQGVPLAGAMVQAKATDQSYSQSVTSDADGKFRLKGLAEGSYALVGMKKNFFEEVGREALASRGSGSQSIMKRVSSFMKKMARAQVRVREGETSRVQLEVPASKGQRVNPDLRGRVHLGGVPLAQGMVSLTPIGAGALPLMGTVEKGQFRVENVPDGSYRIRFQKGFGSGPVGEEKELRLKGSRRLLQFSFPGSLLEGKVLRPDGSPAGTGLIVRFWKQGGRSEAIDDPNPWFNGNATLTSSKGVFRFQGISPGAYDLEVSSFGFLRKASGSGELKGIVLGEGERRTDLVIHLSKGGEIQVQVLADGKPLKRAVVRLLDSKGKPKDLFQVQVTDADGRASFDRVADGDWKILARSRNWASTLSPIQTVREGSSVSVRLELSKGIAVDLSISKDLKLGGMAIFSVWKRDGTFVLQGGIPGPIPKLRIGNLEPGAYRLRVESAFLGRKEEEVAVPSQGTALWVLK